VQVIVFKSDSIESTKNIPFIKPHLVALILCHFPSSTLLALYTSLPSPLPKLKLKTTCPPTTANARWSAVGEGRSSKAPPVHRMRPSAESARTRTLSELDVPSKLNAGKEKAPPSFTTLPKTYHVMLDRGKKVIFYPGK